jgi:hypothetical protein
MWGAARAGVAGNLKTCFYLGSMCVCLQIAIHGPVYDGHLWVSVKCLRHDFANLAKLTAPFPGCDGVLITCLKLFLCVRRDGEQHNLSWNCGEEGPSQQKSVQRLRARQMRNLAAALLLAHGIPMVHMGDEYGHTKVVHPSFLALQI